MFVNLLLRLLTSFLREWVVSRSMVERFRVTHTSPHRILQRGEDVLGIFFLV